MAASPEEVLVRGVVAHAQHEVEPRERNAWQAPPLLVPAGRTSTTLSPCMTRSSLVSVRSIRWSLSSCAAHRRQVGLGQAIVPGQRELLLLDPAPRAVGRRTAPSDADPGASSRRRGPRPGPIPAPLAGPAPCSATRSTWSAPARRRASRGTAADDGHVAQPGQPAEHRQQPGSGTGLLQRRLDGNQSAIIVQQQQASAGRLELADDPLASCGDSIADPGASGPRPGPRGSRRPSGRRRSAAAGPAGPSCASPVPPRHLQRVSSAGPSPGCHWG